ncbi:MAG: hypothetical protein ACYC2G_11645 [Gemmatimonadaceae bacterium]
MSTPVSRPRPVTERVAWSDGCALTHGDLAAAVAHEERMLALHVAALHDTWGVALGLAVAVGADGRSVLVGPGLAYTAGGHALILAVATPAPAFPSGASTADLVIGAPLPDDAWPCERLAHCDGRTRRARLSLRWAPVESEGLPRQRCVGAYQIGEEVVLSRFVRRADGTLPGPDRRPRQTARGLLRPHLAHGALGPGALSWSHAAFDFVATVDTRVAGFSTPPRYAAWVAAAGAWPGGVVGPFVSIEDATATSFTLRLLFAARPGTPAGSGPLSLPILQRLTTTSVVWLGAENARGCPPSLTASAILELDPSLWSVALAALQGGAS